MTTMYRIDALDARIVLALDDEPDATTLALARTLGVSRNTVHARLLRLAREGALSGHSDRLALAAMGYDLVAFVSLEIDQDSDSGSIAGLTAIPEVVEVHSTTGRADLLVRVVAKDTEDLHRLTRAIVAIPGVVRSDTAISLERTMPHRTSALLERLAGGQESASAGAARGPGR
ncbi:AsnC family transcriptional regulator [Curtobacterium sp. Leaf261]|nr:AsnC family transcriptional regulator [Curtobacterium sp. Leaf261]